MWLGSARRSQADGRHPGTRHFGGPGPASHAIFQRSGPRLHRHLPPTGTTLPRSVLACRTDDSLRGHANLRGTGSDGRKPWCGPSGGPSYASQPHTDRDPLPSHSGRSERAGRICRIESGPINRNSHQNHPSSPRGSRF